MDFEQMLDEIAKNKNSDSKRNEIKGKRKSGAYFGDVMFCVDHFNGGFSWTEHYSGGSFKSSSDRQTKEQILDRLNGKFGECYDIKFKNGKEVMNT